jgi:hypothetical protein
MPETESKHKGKVGCRIPLIFKGAGVDVSIWVSLAGGFLPDLTRRCGLDPARPLRNATNCSRANKTVAAVTTGYLLDVIVEQPSSSAPKCQALYQ